VHRKLHRLPVVASATVLLVVVMTTGTPAQTDLAKKGEAILDKNCSRCHAIGKTGASLHATAPPFRVVVTRYPPDSLAEALAEGIVSGRPDMPEFAFDPDEIEAIVTYLDSLIEPAKK